MEGSPIGRCIVITGPSGSGKTRLVGDMLNKVPGTSRLITVTTRDPRPGEVDGEHYHFVSKEEFEAMVAADEFVEWANVYGKLYGATRQKLDEQRLRNRVVLATVDTKGARAYRERVPGAELVMVTSPLSNLERRLLADRPNMTVEERQRRLSEAEQEMAYATSCDYVVPSIDDHYDEAEAALREIVTDMGGEK